MNSQGMMSHDELRQFFAGLNEPGALLGRDLPEDVVFDDGEVDLAQRRIARIENELVPGLKDKLQEEHAAMERFVKTQAPRNWEANREWWEAEHGIDKLRAQMASLELERSKLLEVIERTHHARAEKKALEAKEREEAFLKKVKGAVEGLRSMPKETSAVVELARRLGGKSLDGFFSGFLAAVANYSDLAVEGRYLKEEYNLRLGSVPVLKMDGHEELRRAIEGLTGKELKLERNMRWRRVAAEQRAADRDRAAERLGIKALFSRSKASPNQEIKGKEII